MGIIGDIIALIFLVIVQCVFLPLKLRLQTPRKYLVKIILVPAVISLFIGIVMFSCMGNYSRFCVYFVSLDILAIIMLFITDSIYVKNQTIMEQVKKREETKTDVEKKDENTTVEIRISYIDRKESYRKYVLGVSLLLSVICVVCSFLKEIGILLGLL